MAPQRYVYVIEAQIGVLKIGVAADPQQRLAAVRLHSPVPTRLIAFWPGTQADETALHSFFIRHQSHSEWFRIEGDVLDFLVEVRGRGVSTIEPWENCVFSLGGRSRSAAEQSARVRARWADPAYRWKRAKERAFQKEWARVRAAAVAAGRMTTGEEFQAVRAAIEAEYVGREMDFAPKAKRPAKSGQTASAA